MIFPKDFYSIADATILLNKIFDTDFFTQKDIIDFYLSDYFNFCVRVKRISEKEIDLFSFKHEINAKTVNLFYEPVNNAFLSIVGNNENYLDVILDEINGYGYFSIPKEVIEIGENIKIYGLEVFANDCLEVSVIDDLIPEEHSSFRTESLRISIEEGLELPIEQILISKNDLLNATAIIKEQHSEMLAKIKPLDQIEKEINGKSETSYLNIIGALLDTILECGKFENQAALISYLEKQYQGYTGLSERNLKGKFAKANQSLKTCL
ncbi:hypothetical protein NYR76_02825 [Actinobacillus equuli subsp. equuli]|uniref:hypothetical protein n=1 Tax=Actinobacillus equuli TaxID=718 RepID=UPI002442CF41|nr:hypothetical protein [Actinobacillus equuli]WGE65910.1 hypothetical protein NYR76_02825 [Actinobacillus equuli subsp. equuli]